MVREYLWDMFSISNLNPIDIIIFFILSFDQVALASYIFHDLQKFKSDFSNDFLPPINKKNLR